MLKKLMFSFAVVAMGMVGIASLNPLSATTSQVNLNGEISSAEKLLVCCEMADLKVMDLGTALTMLRDGRLTITKIDTGIYRVVYPGGLLEIAVLIDS